jgi:hypothetical protein
MKGGVLRAHALLKNIQGDQRKKCLEGLSTTNRRREVPSTRGDKREITYRVSHNSRIPNSERGRERPSEAQKILRKKNRSS